MRCTPVLNILTLERLELTATCMLRPCCADIDVKASKCTRKGYQDLHDLLHTCVPGTGFGLASRPSSGWCSPQI